MSRYTSATDADRAAMLEAIGVASTEELFADIPEKLRLDRPLDLPDGRSETEVFDQLAALAARNADADSETCFIGAGMYDHYVPALVDAIVSRSEFLTPYTPYQPEVSQGGLQVMFEFQTAISELTALPVANASLYEGPSSVASAAYLALGAGKRERRRLVVSRGLHPHARATLETYAHGFGAKVVEVGLRDGVTDPRESRTTSTPTSPPSSSRTRTSSAPWRTWTRSLPPRTNRVPSASPPSTRSCSGSCARRGSAGWTSPWARASRWATGSTSAVRRSASSPRPRSTCAGCPAGSPARPPTSTAGADSSSHCRPASSTSGARRRPTTSAPRRP